jgi:hypothetical protein
MEGRDFWAFTYASLPGFNGLDKDDRERDVGVLGAVQLFKVPSGDISQKLGEWVRDAQIRRREVRLAFNNYKEWRMSRVSTLGGDKGREGGLILFGRTIVLRQNGSKPANKSINIENQKRDVGVVAEVAQLEEGILWEF